MAQLGSIDDFKASLTGGNGFAKPNLYYVHLPEKFGNSRPLNFFCKSITLPSRQIMTQAREFSIHRQLIPYGYETGQVTMTFRVLNDQNAREYFRNWQDYIVSEDENRNYNYNLSFPDQYMDTINIYQIERQQSLPVFNRNRNVELGPLNINLDLDIDITGGGIANYMWTLDKAYPITYQAETLADDANGQVSEITVEFSYKNWSAKKVRQGESPSLSGSASISTDIGNQISSKIYDILN